MRIRTIMLFFISSCFTQASGFFLLINTNFINETNEMMDVFCQVTRPMPDCYGEGCLWSAWPERKIPAGQSRSAELWITRDDESRMVVSLFGALEGIGSTTSDRYLLQHMQEGTPLLGEIELEYSIIEGGLFVTKHSHNVDCQISGSRSGYQMNVTVR